ncbi:3'-5' exonuclease [Methylobacterium organophilum]|uniref:3'-5' exonuclease n=1 Tax=Methylobacterium organophilum TaxID=410 RepID=UPI001F130B85|nr:3'-5' exonuclease [Methylobacterium organophilum]UMY16873.1 3'-5' exonuclease [Methylobacterium organophilum]
MRQPLPPHVVAVDVETTGLGSGDRIVTLAAICLETSGLESGAIDLEYMHLAFDPRKDCHPAAAAVHGYSDWDLRHQDLFSHHAETIRSFIHRAPLIVAHNAAFDMRFICSAFEQSGVSPVTNPVFCTMEAYRKRGFSGSASLDAVCKKIGAVRYGARHGALEDAWLALKVYLWLHGWKGKFDTPEALRARPVNWVEPPPLPEGLLPSRARRS